MSRHFKGLGLALVAIFAMSALAVSSASANPITSTSGPYPKHLVGEDVGEADTFTDEGGSSISCHGESYSATLNEPSTTLTAFPEYGETCQTVGSGWNVTVTENGCALEFHWHENVATDHDKVGVTVVCPVGKAIEIHHYTSSSHGTVACTNTVASQTAAGTLSATSETASGDILLHGTVHVTQQTHSACSFGFTINRTAIFHASTTIRDKAGTRIHIGKKAA